MDGQAGRGKDRRSGGWAAGLVIAVIWVAYRLYDAGDLSRGLAIVAGVAGIVVILSVRGAVRSHARKRREMLARLASDMHQVASRD